MDDNDIEMNSFFLNNKLPYILFSYTLGIIYARTGKQIVLICVLAITALIAFLFFSKIKKPLLSSLLLITFSIFGYFNVTCKFQRELPENHIARYLSEKKVNFIGSIIRNPEQQKNGERLYVSVEKLFINGTAIKAEGTIRISTYFLYTGLHFGDRVKFEKVRLRIPENFDNPGGFDYIRFLKDREIFVTGSLSKKEQFHILFSPEKKTPYSFLLEIGNKLAAIIDDSVSSPADNLLRTMVLGEKGILDNEIRSLFSKTGIAHLLSVSGLHVGFIGILFFWIFKHFFQMLFFRINIRYLLLGHPAKFASFITIFFVIAYAVMTGSSPPAVRAAIMTSVYLCAIIIGKEREIFSSIILAASILLVLNPLELFDIGFQLSFAGTIFFVCGAMVWDEMANMGESANIYTKKREWFYKIINLLKKSLFLSLVASFGTLPLTAYYFYIVSVISPLTNIFAIPIAGVIVPSVISAGFLSLFAGDFSRYFFWLPETLAKFLVSFTEIFLKIPYCYLRTGSLSLYSVFIYYILMILLFIFRKKISMKSGISCSSFLLISVLVLPDFPSESTGEKKLKIVFLDVGHGNSAFITFPSGENMLIDAGGASGDFNLGEWVVAPFLWSSNIRKIDYVIGTHADRDHIGGLTYILKEFEVSHYMDNGFKSDEPSAAKIRKIIEERGISYQRVISGDEIILNAGAKIEFLSPYQSGQSDNELTVVSRVSFGKFSALFTGDIVGKVEKKIVSRAVNLKSTIMDSPHHGSRYSSSEPFLKKISPEAIIVSSGKNNPFGHPHIETIGRYKDIGAKIFRTDHQGAITVLSDGTEYSIKTFLD